jgi:hypothetical protein
MIVFHTEIGEGYFFIAQRLFGTSFVINFNT